MRCLLVSVLALSFSFTAMAADSYKPNPLSAKDRFIAGGIIGTVVGFGIGHAIEDRYADLGWVFTATEGASVALIIIGAVVPMPAGASIPLIIIGSLGLTGFKIWEIMDIWSGSVRTASLFPADSLSNERTASFTLGHIAPTRDAVSGLGLSFNF